MSIGKRAYLYITRKKERSIRLFLIFSAAGFFLLTGLAMREGAKEAAGEFRRSLAAGLTLTCKPMNPYDMVDIDLNEKGETVLKCKLPLITEQHVEKLLAVDGVSGLFCDRESVKVYMEQMLLPGADSRALAILEGKVSEEYEGQREYLEEYREVFQMGAHIANVIGVYGSRWHPAFINGAVELVGGRHIEPEDMGKAVISDQLAEKNGLKIGDRLAVQNFEDMENERFGSFYEMEIAGIFHINFEQPIGEYTKEPQLLANMIFGTSELIYWSQYENQVYQGKEIIARESEHYLESLVLFIEEPERLESVKEKLLHLSSIGWKYYDMGVYDKDYQTAAAPLLMMKKLSDLLLAAVVIGAWLLLFNYLTVWNCSRKQEIGILFLSGIKKRTVFLQFVLECCFVAAAAFPTAALFSGPMAQIAGNGLWTFVFSASNTRGYEVLAEQWDSKIEINLLPVKGSAPSFVLTPKMLLFVFLVLTGMAAAAVLASSVKAFGQKKR